MKPAQTVLCLASFLVLGGCVFPFPFRSTRTPELSGRVVDAAKRAPLPNATVAFLQGNSPLTFAKPTATTDAAGRFHLPRTHNYHAVFIFGGMCNSSAWPNGESSHTLLVQHDSYASKEIDLNAAFKASSLSDPNRFMGFEILCYDKPVPLGDISLKR